MESHGRRSRRGRHANPPQLPQPVAVLPQNDQPVLGGSPIQGPPPRRENSWSNRFGSFLILACLISVIYLMLEYHCQTCAARCNLDNISRNIETIADNLAIIRSNYQHLETKVTLFSQELPRLGGQLEILEVLANTASPVEYKPHRMGWDPKSPFCLPNVDVYLNHCSANASNFNSTSRHSKQCLQCPRPIKVQ